MASMAVYDNFLTTYLVTYIPAIHVFYIDIIQPDGHSSDQNLMQLYSPCPGSSKKISEVQTYGGSRHAKQQPDQSKEQTTLIPGTVTKEPRYAIYNLVHTVILRKKNHLAFLSLFSHNF